MFFQIQPIQIIVDDLDPAFKRERVSLIIKVISITLLLVINSFIYSEAVRPWNIDPSPATQKQLIDAEKILDKDYEELLNETNTLVQEIMPKISEWFFVDLEFRKPRLAGNKHEIKVNRDPCLSNYGFYDIEEGTLNIDPFLISSIKDQFLEIMPKKTKMIHLKSFYGKDSITKDCKKKQKTIKDADLLKTILKSEASGTMAHELFHAVQAGEKGFCKFMLGSDCGNSIADIIIGVDKDKDKFYKGHEWISESTASAVERAWKKYQGGTFTQGYRFYDFSLYKAEEESADYATALFWLFLGKKINSPYEVKYLDKFLTGDFTDKDHGLIKINEKLAILEGKTEETKNLYSFYPLFIAEEVNKKKYYKNVQKASISHSGGKKAKIISKKGEVKRVAAQATLLKVKVPTGFEGELEIKLKDKNENLHLSVDTDLYNQDGDSRNLASISSPFKDDEYFIRVANIAKNVSKTSDLEYELEITLRPFVYCEKSRQSGLEKTGAPTISDVNPGKGEMVVSGSISGQGIVCSDVVTGVPSFNSGALGTMTMSGKIASFTLYSPVTPQIEFKGNHMFPFPHHGGIGGWKPNSRYEVAVLIDGTEWKLLEKGETYPATVRAMAWEWQGDVTEYTHETGQPINLLTGNRTQNWPGGKSKNGTVKIIDKGRLKNGAMMIKAKISGVEKFPKGTFTTSSTIATTRNDGYQYEKKNGFTSKDTINVESIATIYCDAYYCK